MWMMSREHKLKHYTNSKFDWIGIFVCLFVFKITHNVMKRSALKCYEKLGMSQLELLNLQFRPRPRNFWKD